MLSVGANIVQFLFFTSFETAKEHKKKYENETIWVQTTCKSVLVKGGFAG